MISSRRPLPKKAAVDQPSLFMDELDDPVTITSEDGADSAAFVLFENAIGTGAGVHATGSGTIAYSIVGGADAALFDIQATYGTLYFAIGFSPDYEAPADADGNGSYEVIVQASNGSTTTSRR